MLRIVIRQGSGEPLGLDFFLARPLEEKNGRDEVFISHSTILTMSAKFRGAAN